MTPRTSAAKVKESDLQRTILDWLGYQGHFFYRNNSGAMISEYKGKQRFMRFGAPGSPDIVVVHDGLYVGIEVKGTGGKQNDNQKEFQRGLEDAGGRYVLAYSLKDVEEEFNNL